MSEKDYLEGANKTGLYKSCYFVCLTVVYCVLSTVKEKLICVFSLNHVILKCIDLHFCGMIYNSFLTVWARVITHF